MVKEMEIQPNVSSDANTAEIREILDYLVDCVVAVVPHPMKETKTWDAEIITVGGENDSETESGDSDIELIAVGSQSSKQSDGIENLTCEVSFDSEFTKCCLVCEAEGDLLYQVYDQGKLQFLCSQECLNLHKRRKNLSCHQCKEAISVDSQAYTSNFGPDKAAFCSDMCLLKFEAENEPVSKCFECNACIEKSGKNAVVYYWQTMEFCSIQCVVNLQYFLGEKCAFCKKKINKFALGKYSVRFGDVIKQFCDGNCLEHYKRGLRFCAFCQKDLKGCASVLSNVVSPLDKRKSREFCDPICKKHYEGLVTLKSETNNQLTVGCDQCQRFINKSAMTTLNYQGRLHYLCGSTCISAFKFSHNISAIVCESCYSFGWPLTNLTPLHYNGIVKLFCSKKCLNMYVLKNRKIVSCLHCKVKKYDFDLIEKYECDTNNSKMYCSLNCLSICKSTVNSSSENECRILCESCRKTASVQYQVKLDGVIKHFCSQKCANNQRFALSRVETANTVVSPPTSVLNTTFMSREISVSSTTQPTAVKPIVAASQPQIRFVAPPNMTLTPSTSSSSRMWTPSFASMQPTTVSITNPNAGKVSSTTPIILQRKAPVTATVSAIVSRETIMTVPVTAVCTASSMSPLRTSTVPVNSPSSSSGITKERILIRQAPPKPMSNKMTMFRSPSISKAIGCKPLMFDKSAQVDEEEANDVDQKPITIRVPIPVPVPIPMFVPIPIPYPHYVPFPFPIPIPLFFERSGTYQPNNNESCDLQNDITSRLISDDISDSFSSTNSNQKREKHQRVSKRKAENLNEEKFGGNSSQNGEGSCNHKVTVTTALKDKPVIVYRAKKRTTLSSDSKRSATKTKLLQSTVDESSNSSTDSSDATSSDDSSSKDSSKGNHDCVRSNLKNTREETKAGPASMRSQSSQKATDEQEISYSNEQSKNIRLRDRNRRPHSKHSKT